MSTPERLLAEANERNAALTRLLERQGLQLDRMQDQLEKALREIAALRRQLGKLPPEDPVPPPPPAPASPPPASPDAAGAAGSPAPPPAPPPPSKPPPKKPSSFGRNKLPASLDRVTDGKEVNVCPRCGSVHVAVVRPDIHEVYDYVPARLVARVVDRPVSYCPPCDALVQPPLAADLIPKLLATPAVLAHIVYEKFGRHLPLNRIDAELRRLGGEIREVTRDRWLQWSARHLDLLLPSLKLQLFVERLIHTDGTGLPVLAPGTKVRLGQMAVFCNARAVIYDYTPSKHGCHQRRFLGVEGANGGKPEEDAPRFVGFQVADAASIADRTYLGGTIVECGCNAHARRMFEHAEATDRRLASEALAFWTVLYRVERQAKRMDASSRLALRREKSVPVVKDLRRWLDDHRGRFLPQDLITKALNYLHNHWDALFRFLTDGSIPIDNNLAERMLKAVAVGRRSYMFAGNDRAARRSATFYTWVETCRLHGVDPPTWLADVLPRIATTRPSEYPDLLPQRWAELRRVRAAA